ncbi:hydantoinase/oxoprolinase family protein [Microbacterium enclense]|uniref:hydantoinase/oxoprolinase family protein n=1 Tax=Microbacterium enclense TaxID=993073 RepID=UPI0021A30E18|nr:hydantoinase/oxoprolinase family protein [Microbacterium enclense]MCT2085163.1 hydantoinase/oxoprolinase family protein [Microbacterium enclense]
MPHLRIGIDVGGTNTDAVLLDGDTVVAWTKQPTTEDVTSGIGAALDAVLAGSDPAEVAAVFIGTTHFINALAEARGLDEVGFVRLATPPQSILPHHDWPSAVRDAIGEHIYVCVGGSQFDGRALSPLDEGALRVAAADIGERGLRRVAVSAVFSTVNPAHEIRAAEILRQELPGVSITRSIDVGRTGLLERENATILNASLLTLAGVVVEGLEQVVRRAGMTAPILLSQNDGTVMTLAHVREFPIFTIASGPTNSMRGASLLTGIRDGVVIDVGGTTSDVGLLQHGFPRESTVAMSLAGVRSSFQIPDVLSLALGGGSVVGVGGSAVGPRSVGYRISQEARVFGGPTVTFTDVAVAGGAPAIGDPRLLADLPRDVVSGALEIARERIVTAIENVRISADDTPVIVVGGGASLLRGLPGLDHLIIPDRAGVANAVGAAYAEAGGEVDRVFHLDGRSRDEVIAEAKAEAIASAVKAGASPETVRIIDVDDVPLTHMGGTAAIRVRVKAVGPFASLAVEREVVAR